MVRRWFLSRFVVMYAGLWGVSQAHAELIQLAPGDSPVSFELKNKLHLKEVSKELRLYEAQIEAPSASQRHLRAAALRKTGAHLIPNHPVQWRGDSLNFLTSDPLLPQQWNMMLDSETIGINAVESWLEFGTGGKNANAQDIVIAIVDAGFDHSHPDLIFNRWRNWGEIPANGKDDDENGYVDDVNGWNAQEQTGQIHSDDHGTHVAGIIGARGNNSRGIAGLNWRLKIMYVSMGHDLGDTISTMRAYSYILKQKELWLQSGGKKGANVVAINSSFGIDARKCSHEDFVIWNEMINTLGEKGILSVAATSNFEINVDKHGDIPTSCDSPYLISVTNSGRTGKKSTGVEWNPELQEDPGFDNFGAGFGEWSIDIAAPGEEILSTAERNFMGPTTAAYTAQTGTSFSTPHVAGAVGYLHSVASSEFQARALDRPAASALEIKEALLLTVTPTSSLHSATASGGVLNLHAASTYFKQSGREMEKLLAF